MHTPDAKGRIRKARIGRFNEPKKITNEDFANICEIFCIPLSDQQNLRRWFDELVKEFADWVRDDRRQPDRGADRDQIKKALKHVRTVTDCLDRLGPSGRLARQSTYQGRLVNESLKEIEVRLIQMLQALDRQPGAGGGPRTKDYLYYMVINLAVKWAALGREVSTGSKTDFMAFCELAFEAIGWPTSAISSAVRLRGFDATGWPAVPLRRIRHNRP